MAPSALHMLVLLCLCGSGVSSADKDNHATVTVSVGGKATIRCKPQTLPQDGVYLYKKLFQEQKVTYFYKDGTLTPKYPFETRLESNKYLMDFAVSIKNVTVQDTGVYWCVFNNEDKNSDCTHKTLLVVSGKEIFCPEDKSMGENTYMLLIIVCVAVAFVMLLITVILLWTIPKIKRCCERGKFVPHHPPGDGVYEEMRGRRTSGPNTLVNPAYQSSRRLHPTESYY